MNIELLVAALLTSTTLAQDGYGPPPALANVTETATPSTTETPSSQSTTEEPLHIVFFPLETTEAPSVSVEQEAEQSSSTTDELPESGMDVHEHCCFWAQAGECDSNPYWMRPRCQKSCGTTDCTVENAASCPVSLNVGDCKWQREGGIAGVNSVLEVVPAPPKGCNNNHRLCNFWKNRMQCLENAAWMSINCPVSCDKCSQAL